MLLSDRCPPGPSPVGFSCSPLLVLLAAACSPEHYPQTALRPLSDFAKIGDDIQTTTFYWAVGVFVLVEGALLYAVFRFRGKPDDAEPQQVHGNTTVEIIWTVIPALILAAIAVPTVRGIFQTDAIPTGDVLKVEVMGHQWWWEFRYPDLNLTTANEIHVPVGQTVSLRMGTADVVHSFWPPRFAGKRDVFPNRETRLWFKAEQAGEYPGPVRRVLRHPARAHGVPGAGADARGVPGLGGAHADARRQARGRRARRRPTRSGPPAPAAHTAGRPDKPGAPAKAAAAIRRRPPRRPRTPPTPPGEKLFLAKGCVGCHSLDAVDAPKGMIGPNLANVGARSYIGAGTLQEHRREPRPLDPESAGDQEGRADAQPRRERPRRPSRSSPTSALTNNRARMATTALDQQRAHAAAGHAETTGLWSWLTTVDHKRIGILYGVTAFVFFLMGGIEALLIRIQLGSPNNTFVSPETYNQLFTMHGTTMIFLAIMPLVAMFFNFLIPLQIGARDVAFPRLNAFSYWVFLFGGLFINSSFLFGAAPNGGWFGYANLTTRQYSPGLNIDFWMLGLQILGIASLAAAFNFIVDDHQHARAGHEADAHADVHLDERSSPSSCSCWPSRSSRSRWSCSCSTASSAPTSSCPPAAATRCSGSTCSGSSVTPRSTS